MKINNKNDAKTGITRKATPEEIAYYSDRLNKESTRLRKCRDLKVSNSITVEGKYSTTGID